MKASDVSRARVAATAIAKGCGLAVDHANVVHDSNKLSLHLSPCDVFARVAHVGREVAAFEVEIARALARGEACHVAALDPRVAPVVYERAGFAVTLWTYHGPQSHVELSPADYANGLVGLHAGMRTLAVEVPHFTDRVTEAQQLVSSKDRTPELSEADRALLGDTLRGLRRAVDERGAVEQLLHGEPHPGNVLGTEAGPRFIDLETCCRGPVEFDLAHVPEAVCDHYPHVDPALLDDCRGLVLAMVTAWRFDRDDEFPNGPEEGHKFLRALRAGPPWRTLAD